MSYYTKFPVCCFLCSLDLAGPRPLAGVLRLRAPTAAACLVAHRTHPAQQVPRRVCSRAGYQRPATNPQPGHLRRADAAYRHGGCATNLE